MSDQKNEYLPAPSIQARYNISPITLWRWLHDPTLGFPPPLTINRRRFFKRAEIEAWERNRIRLSQVAAGRMPCLT